MAKQSYIGRQAGRQEVRGGFRGLVYETGLCFSTSWRKRFFFFTLQHNTSQITVSLSNMLWACPEWACGFFSQASQVRLSNESFRRQWHALMLLAAHWIGQERRPADYDLNGHPVGKFSLLEHDKSNSNAKKNHRWIPKWSEQTQRIRLISARSASGIVAKFLLPSTLKNFMLWGGEGGIEI